MVDPAITIRIQLGSQTVLLIHAGIQLPAAGGAGLPGDLDGTVPVPQLE